MRPLALVVPWLVAACGRIAFDPIGTGASCAPPDAMADASVSATGTTYYVATDGDDARTCATATALATPRRTIRGGIACLGAGDTLVVRGGVYAEEIDSATTPFQGGTSSQNMTRLLAYPGEVPIVRPNTGAVRVLTLTTAMASFIEIRGFVFDDTNGMPAIDAGVKITGTSDHIRFVDCEIENAPIAGIYFNEGTGHEVIGLRVHDNGGAGIHMAVPGTLIEHCDVHHNATNAIELYDAVNSVGGTTVRYNLVHDNGGHAMYLGNTGGGNDDVTRNVIWNNDGGIDLYAQNTRVIHNTIVGNAGATSNWCVFVEMPGIPPLVEDNICWRQTPAFAGQIALATFMSNLTVDPSFVDEAAHDFDLAPGSAALDTGIAATGETYAGGPDIGALEQPVARGASLPCTGYIAVTASVGFAPVQVADCTGFTVHSGGAIAPLAACHSNGSEIDLVLADPIATTGAVSIDYAGGTVTDSLAAGSTVSAHLMPFTGLAAR